jgi:hypothetical protein
MSMMDPFLPETAKPDERTGAEPGQGAPVQAPDHEPDVHSGEGVEVPESEKHLEIPDEDPPFRTPTPHSGVDPRAVDGGAQE